MDLFDRARIWIALLVQPAAHRESPPHIENKDDVLALENHWAAGDHRS